MSRVLILACALMLSTTGAFAAQTTFVANDYGAKGDGTTLNTVAIQKTIDRAAKVHGTITLKPGIYLTGSLFLKTGTTLDVPEGVTLIGSQKLADYPELPTRIAGIEMTWPAALINARDQHDVIASCLADRGGDRVAPAGDFACVGPGALHDRGTDRGRILATGVVIGDDHQVGQFRRDRAHRSALALVAVAAGAEHGD